MADELNPPMQFGPGGMNDFVHGDKWREMQADMGSLKELVQKWASKMPVVFYKFPFKEIYTITDKYIPKPEDEDEEDGR